MVDRLQKHLENAHHHPAAEHMLKTDAVDVLTQAANLHAMKVCDVDDDGARGILNKKRSMIMLPGGVTLVAICFRYGIKVQQRANHTRRRSNRAGHSNLAFSIDYTPDLFAV